MRVTSFISRPVKWALRNGGYDAISRRRYGYDALLDIARLSDAWSYSVDTFFDVGANDGSTIRRTKTRFRDCHIVAFEPHPETFSRLEKKTERVQDVTLINKAVGSESGDVTLFEYNDSHVNSLVANAQFAMRFQKEGSKICVECVTLDEFCLENKVNRIDVLKIDTEGFDLEVLLGAKELLKNGCIRFIYVEYNSINSRPNVHGGALAPIDKLLYKFGLKIISCYNDYVVTSGEVFSVCNALYAFPPRGDED